MVQAAGNLVQQSNILDADVRRSAVSRSRGRGIVLPIFAQLSRRADTPAMIAGRPVGAGPDAPRPDNLRRVPWRNAPNRVAWVDVPDHAVMPRALPGSRFVAASVADGDLLINELTAGAAAS